jgi:hypothetical protein
LEGVRGIRFRKERQQTSTYQPMPKLANQSNSANLACSQATAESLSQVAHILFDFEGKLNATVLTLKKTQGGDHSDPNTIAWNDCD